MMNYYVKLEDDDQLQDILNLSPPTNKGEVSFGFSASNPGLLENDRFHPGSENTPPPAPTSNAHHNLPEPENLLNPLTIGYNAAAYSNGFLSPNSPGNQSSHSLYSDVSSNPASPFLGALSNSYDNNIDPRDSFNGSNVDLRMAFGQQTYFDTNVGVFESEIALGASVSSTNLTGMGYEQPQYQNQPVQQQDMFNFQNEVKYSYQNETYLTENNLNNYNKTAPQIIYTNNDDVNIKTENPDDIVRKTPSLFSNSSHNSSINNSPNEDTNKLSPMYHSHNNKTSSPGSVISDISDQSKLLAPEEYHNYKRDRRRSHSRTRSRSGSFSNEETSNVTSSREKMLELASTNQVSKRTQKHPSAYACHLCEKRFTRPYNLKSHLRTHTDERPFICNVCGKAFARQHDRKRHEDLHSGEKKFQCKGFLKDGSPYGCGRRFARADALRRHFQTEAGKECIRLLVEEDEREKKKGNPGNSALNAVTGHPDYLSPPNVPQVAISPPE